MLIVEELINASRKAMGPAIEDRDADLIKKRRVITDGQVLITLT